MVLNAPMCCGMADEIMERLTKQRHGTKGLDAYAPRKHEPSGGGSFGDVDAIISAAVGEAFAKKKVGQ